MKSRSFKLKLTNKEIEAQKSNLQKKATDQQTTLVIPDDPVVFARDFFGFYAKDYQAAFLRDNSKRIVLRWSRQSGKTTALALRSIWFALRFSKTLTLIVAPTLRQSMIVSDRIQDFLWSLPEHVQSELVDRFQRTTIRFENGSRIVALPN